MRRLLLVLSLASIVGCQTAKTKTEWAEAMKDLRGENMEMRMGGKSRVGDEWDEKPLRVGQE